METQKIVKKIHIFLDDLFIIIYKNKQRHPTNMHQNTAIHTQHQTINNQQQHNHPKEKDNFY